MAMDERIVLSSTLALSFLFVLIGPAMAGEVLRAYPPVVTITSSGENRMMMRLEFSGFHVNSVEEGGDTFQMLRIPGCGLLTEEGRPALPIYGTWVKIPGGKMVERASVIECTNITYRGYKVYPAQPPAIDQPEPTISCAPIRHR